ncbi:hypothetical protein [Bradyrhizobium embrapense]
MKDMRAQLEKLRIEAEECELISKLATNGTKKALFAKLAAQHRALADEVEQAMQASQPQNVNVNVTCTLGCR